MLGPTAAEPLKHPMAACTTDHAKGRGKVPPERSRKGTPRLGGRKYPLFRNILLVSLCPTKSRMATHRGALRSTGWSRTVTLIGSLTSRQMRRVFALPLAPWASTQAPNARLGGTDLLETRVGPGIDQFAIGFDHRDRARLHELWDEILDVEVWSEGRMVEAFETAWTGWNGIQAVVYSSWSGAALAALEFVGVRGETVLCPSNTFMATPLSVLQLGGHVEFVDCNREDLCMSFTDFEAKASKYKPKIAFVVHIGGHLSFDIQQIADYCRAEGIFLIEDCAHAHGASWFGRHAGTWGDAGIWSFAPTKTISTGEGGALVSRHSELIDFARSFRNYGKPDYAHGGLNFRMNEFTAAVGMVQTERLDEITRWKNEVARKELDRLYPGRVEFPDGMVSGHYKYIVFQDIPRSTGRVYAEPCHRILDRSTDLPNTEWVATHHSCVPFYYRPDSQEPKKGETS
jgi:perosamine synthetase